MAALAIRKRRSKSSLFEQVGDQGLRAFALSHRGRTEIVAETDMHGDGGWNVSKSLVQVTVPAVSVRVTRQTMYMPIFGRRGV